MIRNTCTQLSFQSPKSKPKHVFSLFRLNKWLSMLSWDGDVAYCLIFPQSQPNFGWTRSLVVICWTIFMSRYFSETVRTNHHVLCCGRCGLTNYIQHSYWPYLGVTKTTCSTAFLLAYLLLYRFFSPSVTRQYIPHTVSERLCSVTT